MSASWTEKVREGLGLGPGESRYAPVNQDGSLEGQQQPQPQPSRRRFIAKVAASLSLIWLFIFLAYRSGIAGYHTSASDDDGHIKSNFFHLVIPGSSAGFCRTLFSAGALNYPTPRIVNWDKKFEDSEKLDGGFHLAKIEGVNDFLQKLDGSHHHELVYIPDGLDTWFQLRPEVLIQRYNNVRHRLEQRAWPRYGLKYDQTIIFSAQKKCEAGENAFPCSMVPPSDVPEDMYGVDVAKPQYLNSGSIMGTVGALKALFGHAKWKSEQRKYFSDQEVFAEIFGDQEYYREKVLFENPEAGNSSDVSDPRNGRVHEPTIKLPCDSCQFGIGLDYWGELSTAAMDFDDSLVPINYAEDMDSFVDFDLPEDIIESTPPFWTPDYSGDVELPSKSWSEISLITNKHSGVRPVTVHHGATNDPSKPWQQNWHFPYLRTLTSAHAKSPRIAFAVVKDDEGQIREYWGPNDGFGGARVHDPKGLPGQWKQWDELCGSEEVAKDVFADDLGVYKNPVYYLYWDGNKQNDQIKTWQERMDAAKKPFRR